jgi:hypothetical protein
MKLEERLAPWWAPTTIALVGAWVVFTPPLAAMVGRLVPLGAAAIFVAAIIGWGAPVASLLIPSARPTDQGLLALFVGAGLTGLFTFLPAVAGIVDPLAYSAWTVLGLGALGWWMVRRRPFSAGDRTAWPALDGVALAAMVVSLLVILPAVSAPVASTDAMEYHLMIPRLVLAEGRWGPMPTIVESGYPHLASGLYLLVMPLAGDIACKGLHFWFGIAVLVAISRLVGRVAPDGSRLLAPAAYLSMPVAGVLLSVAWNDHLFVGALLVALTLLVDHHVDPQARSADRRRRLIAAGIAMGVAAWTKYTIVLFLLGVAPLMLLMVLRRRWRVSDIAWVAAPVLALSLVVFVKNWAFTQNPFYPFLHQVFPSPFWSDASAAYFSDAVRRWEIPDWRWHTPVTFIWHMVLTPRLIDIHTGILPLVLLPFAFGRRRGEALSLLRWYCVFQFAAWTIIQTETRSLLTLVAVLCCIEIPAFERLIAQRARRRIPALAALVVAWLAAVGILAVNLLFVTQPMAYFIRQEGRSEYLHREVHHYAAAEWLHGRSDITGTLLVGLKRPYYIPGRTWFSAFADIPIAQVFTRGAVDVDDLHRRLLGRGVSHVVVDWAEYAHDHDHGLYTWSDAERRAFEELIERHSDRVADFDQISIYRLR